MKKKLGIAALFSIVGVVATSAQAGERSAVQAMVGTTTVGQNCITGGTATGPTLGVGTMAYNRHQNRMTVTLALKGAAPNTPYVLEVSQFVTDGSVCLPVRFGTVPTDGSGNARAKVQFSPPPSTFRAEAWLVSSDTLSAGSIEITAP